MLWKVNVALAMYSAAYMTQTQRDQKRFAISDVAAHWHELATNVRYNVIG